MALFSSVIIDCRLFVCHGSGENRMRMYRFVDVWRNPNCFYTSHLLPSVLCSCGRYRRLSYRQIVSSRDL